ncbi:rRNA maturation RNase YbeY [Bacillus subtilis]|jgi:probable rRNA maturation factor|uniref:Endoribonuclease YbeY n=5 Tax=Bacillus subtilis TaxID=1423 RepID=YBEY_BACSU|nr:MULTISPECIES: rRNA maturation RNase YbeY [Bacillales]NP_390410.2 endonuclease involved in 70S ribosomes quality control [Bacillus subtilis subsp. subtilis str. 168]P46347.3 RecName: Full=Endoribonuclease YbeY [Bacillus subtilis subsp. subtilis str. 168]AOL30284.1 rRNA maturation RNase YbeY [Alkalicoccobacillus gibsonii]AXC53605.1 endoribonuclease YbeY [Bacillus spizizenii]MBW4823758.1 rRNA maturation RNase YbeY [Bacillaceae bacterium]MDP4100168.1 rRNA maturation RNase YbeY [Bacillota bacte
MSLLIDIVDETGSVSEEMLKEVENLLQFAAEREGVQDQAEVSVTIVSNDDIHQINKEYRGKDAPTDVISFALEEEGEGEIEIVGAEMPPVLGDIIISADRTREQAEEYNHSFKRELGFLAVHGFLHLLGYDHMTKEEEEEMFTKQKELLDAYGLKRS